MIVLPVQPPPRTRDYQETWKWFFAMWAALFKSAWTLVATTFNGVIFAQMTITGDTTLTAMNVIADCNAIAGPFSVFLPTAVGIKGTCYMLKKIDTSMNAVTIDPAGGELIDTEATLPLEVPGEAIIITSDGAGWNVR